MAKVDIFATDNKYNIIYADPPWSYNDKMHGHSFSLEHEYQTMPLQWIKELPIKNICEKDCILFCGRFLRNFPKQYRQWKVGDSNLKQLLSVGLNIQKTESQFPTLENGRWEMLNCVCLV